MYASLIVLLPGIYISYLTFRWLYQRNLSKSQRVHRTKIAMWLFLCCLIPVYLAYIFASRAISALGQPFWINTVTYYLFITVIAGFMFLIVKGTNSRKNITKLVVIILTLLIYAPAIWWSYQVFSVGIDNGKFGVTKNLAAKAVDNYLTSRINHTEKKIARQKGYWLVEENVSTRDHTMQVPTKYRVNYKDGSVSNDNGGTATEIHLAKESGSTEGTEMLLFVQQPADTSGQPGYTPVEYSATGSDGKTSLSLVPNSGITYVLQVRDCGVTCQDFFFVLKQPTKAGYDIKLNPLQTEMVEL